MNTRANAGIGVNGPYWFGFAEREADVNLDAPEDPASKPLRSPTLFGLKLQKRSYSVMNVCVRGNFVLEFVKRIVVIGVISGLGALALFIASEMNNIIATSDKEILFIMPGVPVVVGLIVLKVLNWPRYFTLSTFLFLLLSFFILVLAILDGMSIRGFYSLIKNVNPDFSAGTGGGYVLELKVMRTLANTMGTLYILSIASLVLFVGYGAYRSQTGPRDEASARPSSSYRQASVGGMNMEEVSLVHWSYWLISLLAVCWFGLGLYEFMMLLLTGGLSQPTFEDSPLPWGLPVWAMGGLIAANIGGVLGAIFLLFRNRSAVYLFMLCLVGVLLIIGYQTSLAFSYGVFSPLQLALNVLFQGAVPTFLLWYTQKTLPKPPLVVNSPVGVDPARQQSEERSSDWASPASPEHTCGFFVFDYNEMDSEYGKRAFSAIYTALQASSGLCAFHDGDVFNLRNVEVLAREASVLRPASESSPLANLDVTFKFGAYFAAMFTDNYANFDRVHEALSARGLKGYLGLIVLGGRLEGPQVTDLFVNQLRLPANVVLQGGSIVPGTDKYGVAQR